MSTIERALVIARDAHAGQVDKAGRPYIEHVLRVVDAVDGEDAKIVAALHDVLEDGEGWTKQRLLDERFEPSIIRDVAILTRPQKWLYQGYVDSIANLGSLRARAVKIADLLDNLDPARLALLPEVDQARLSHKYATALAALGAT